MTEESEGRKDEISEYVVFSILRTTPTGTALDIDERGPDSTRSISPEISVSSYGIFFREDLSRAFKLLDQLYKECSAAGWDGYDAKPVAKEAYIEATKLLHLMPASFPAPDIVSEPEGSIGFEWFWKKSFSFVISVKGDGIVTYAGRFGKNNEMYGTEIMADALPEFIAVALKRLYHL
jgi:hypothetical protein